MQDSLITQTKKEASSSKNLYLGITMLAVIAVVGAGMWCGPLSVDDSYMPIVGQKADVPHYIFNMWENWKTKYGKTYEIYVEEQ